MIIIKKNSLTSFWEYIYILKNHSISFFKFSSIAVYATTDGQLVFGVTFLELGKWGEGSNAGMKLAYENSCAHFKKFDVYKYKITQQIK